ncbi:GATA zinc finger domain-containing protein 15 [Calliphora vicina]|uniref:GATA zinc finger domain-containing protein 15 n=1 Tax=Calliphora vicina TaxID=7373 RepID=UPI00325AC10C
MSLNRGRHIFTLGNFLSNSKRRQSNDPFERDPFKIQSYNFRYAERPSFPMPAVQQRVNNNRKESDCQTYFYNYDFPLANSSFEQRNTALQNEERFLNLNKFQEHRRRKFLQETAFKRNSHLRECNQKKPYESKILNLYYGKGNVPTSSSSGKAKSNYTQNNIPRNSSQNNNQNSSIRSVKNSTVKPISSCQPLNSGHQSLSSSSQGVCAGRSRRSLSSGCEININIKSLEDNSLQDNINIKIETDSLCKQLNIPLNRSAKVHSSDTFVIDKRLSKFSTNPVKPCDIKKSDKDRIKELTSIYSSQKLKKFASKGHIKSEERLPTLIPFRTSSYRIKNSSSCAKENFFQRANTNMEVYDNKANTKGCSYNNNLYRSAYIKNNGGTKLLNSPFLNNLNIKQPPLKSSSSAANRCDFKPMAPLRLRSSSKLPLNVNINVFADKLKLLKV